MRVLYWGMLIHVVLAIVLALFARSVGAETYVYTGAWSEHIGSEHDYNETHSLAAVESHGVIGGYFRNSFSEDVLFAVATLSRDMGHFEASVWVGAMYGYRDCKGAKAYDKSRRACPVAAPTVSYTANTIQPTVIVLGNAVAFSVRWQL